MHDKSDALEFTVTDFFPEVLLRNLPPALYLEWKSGPPGGCGTGWNEHFLDLVEEK